MKKFLLITLCCLLCAAVSSFAEEENGGVQEILSATGEYAGYDIIADDGNDYFTAGADGRLVNHAAVQNDEHAALLVAVQQDGEWKQMKAYTTALFQPGQTDQALQLWHEPGAFDLQYGGEEDGSERYSFSYDEERGDYVLCFAEMYTQRKWYSNSFCGHVEGLIFWQSGPERSFVPIGEAIWRTDGITLSEFNIAQMPRSMAEVRNVSFTAQALDEGSVPLVAQKDTFITDDPTASQRVLFALPAGTELTGLARSGEFYADVEWVQDGQTMRGFVPMKDLMTKYDRVLTTDADLLTADVRWDVIDALCGKWYQVNVPHDRDALLIFFNDGGYRTSRLRTEENRPEGNFRVYDVENGDGSTYELLFTTEDCLEQRFLMRLNEDGTITLTKDGQSTVYDRNEYSSYSNG